MSRPYFKRAWAVQEVLQAREIDIMCGVFSMPFDAFYEKASRMDFYEESPHPLRMVHSGNTNETVEFYQAIQLLEARAGVDNHKQHLMVDDGTLWYDDPSEILVEVLATFSNSQCHDPKDKIFAFLGHPRIRSWITRKADYAMDMEDLAISVMKRYCSLWRKVNRGPPKTSKVNNFMTCLQCVDSPADAAFNEAKAVACTQGSNTLVGGLHQHVGRGGWARKDICERRVSHAFFAT